MEWKLHHDRAGNPMLYYFYTLPLLLFDFPKSTKILSYAYIILNSYFLYKILIKIKIFKNDAFLLVLLSGISICNVTFIEPSHFGYLTGYTLFSFATFIYIYIDKYHGCSKIFLIFSSLLIYFLSFNFNALLSYFYIVIILIEINIFLESKHQYYYVNRSYRYLYIILPIIYWLWKQILNPVYGDQIGYNEIKIGASNLSSLVRLPYMIIIQKFNELIFLPILIIFLFKKLFKKKDMDRTPLVPIGILLLIFSAIPFILTNRGFAIGLSADRMNFLMTVPISFLTLGCIKYFSFKFNFSIKKTIYTILFFLIISIEIRYLTWEIRGIKDNATIHKIINSDIIKNDINYFIIDGTIIKSNFYYKEDIDWYIPHYSTFLFAAAKNRPIQNIIIPVGNTPLKDGLNITDFINKYKMSYYIKNIIDSDPAYLINISPGSTFGNNLIEPFIYYYYKYFDLVKFNYYMDNFIKIEIIPIKQNANNNE